MEIVIHRRVETDIIKSVKDEYQVLLSSFMMKPISFVLSLSRRRGSWQQGIMCPLQENSSSFSENYMQSYE